MNRSLRVLLLCSVFRIVLDNFHIRVLVEVEDIVLCQADERPCREIVSVAYDCSDQAVLEHDTGAEEGFFDVLEERNADSRV